MEADLSWAVSAREYVELYRKAQEFKVTVAVILLPQAIAYALIAELPPQTGLYAAIVGAIVGALWGSSNHLQTGPTNASSLLVLSTLMTIATPGTAEYVMLAGLTAVVAGVIRLAMGLARLGVLVNFVSHSVVVGFTAGAGLLIAIGQLRYLLGLEFSSYGLVETLWGVVIHLPETHVATTILGFGTILLIVLLRRLNCKLPGPLSAMVVAAAAVGIAGLEQQGVAVIGEMPRGLPPLAKVPLLNTRIIGQLGPGALAIAAIGLVEAMSIARSISGHSGQRLDSNQEFVGQGLANFAVYIIKTSVPRVSSVLPDERYRHFVYQPKKAPCPQLAVLDILGDLYFGAVSHVEKAIGQHLAANPTQRLLLLRMHSVRQCDFGGIHALESIVRSIREQGGDLFMGRVREPVLDLMRTTGFWAYLGSDHFLEEDTAISHLFHRVLDSAVCIYECDVRALKECQNLPKHTYPSEIPLHTDIPAGRVAEVPPRELWQRLHSPSPPHVVDVREAREFRQNHIPQAQLVPVSRLLCEAPEFPRDIPIVFVCRGGRRSTRAANLVKNQGYEEVAVLQGGMLAWEAASLLAAVDGGAE